MLLFLQAALIGAIVAVGSIGLGTLITMRRTFSSGWKQGLLVGIGSSFADLMYAAVPAFGLRFVADYMTAWEFYLTLLASVIMMGTGFYYARKNVDFSANASKWQAAGGFGIGFALNALSPGNLVAYGIGFSMLSVKLHDLTTVDGVWLTLGVFVGSILAAIGQVMLFRYLRQKITETTLNKISKGFGIFMLVFGLGILVYAFL